MIVLNLKDGLGNQMFEYAYARQIQKLTSERIMVNTFFFRRLKDRKPSIQNYYLNDNVIFLNKGQEYLYTLLFFIKIVSALGLKKVWQWIVKKQRPNNDRNFNDYAKKGLYYSFVTFNDCDYLNSHARIKFIHGNFESSKYFQGLEGILRCEFVLRDYLTHLQKNMLTMIQNNNSVCVHIRRGDYLNPKWLAFNVCDFAYYSKGMEYLQYRIKNPIFCIFSNTHQDIEWIKNNYHFDKSMNVVFVDCESSDVQDFELMRRCKHFVISNSTYSWWAANMSTNKSKQVIAPKIWFRGESLNWKNMYLEDWIIL